MDAHIGVVSFRARPRQPTSWQTDCHVRGLPMESRIAADAAGGFGTAGVGGKAHLSARGGGGKALATNTARRD